MIGYLANLAIPRLGEVLKCTLLAKYEKVPAEKLVGTIVAERAVDVISLAISSLNRHCDDENIQQHATLLLFKMSKFNVYARAIVLNGGVEAVVSAQKLHLQSQLLHLHFQYVQEYLLFVYYNYHQIFYS
jgi:hypothetical protein